MPLQPWIPDPPAEPVPSDSGTTPEWEAELKEKEQATEYHWWN